MGLTKHQVHFICHLKWALITATQKVVVLSLTPGTNYYSLFYLVTRHHGWGASTRLSPRPLHRSLVSQELAVPGSDVHLWSSKFWLLGVRDRARFHTRKHDCLGLPLQEQELWMYKFLLERAVWCPLPFFLHMLTELIPTATSLTLFVFCITLPVITQYSGLWEP